jgi:hypothetical protein
MRPGILRIILHAVSHTVCLWHVLAWLLEQLPTTVTNDVYALDMGDMGMC